MWLWTVYGYCLLVLAKEQWMSLSQITGDLSVQSIIDVLEHPMGFLSFTIV